VIEKKIVQGLMLLTLVFYAGSAFLLANKPTVAAIPGSAAPYLASSFSPLIGLGIASLLLAGGWYLTRKTQ
jgi:hypothetical protein